MASQRHKIEQPYLAANGETRDIPGWGGQPLVNSSVTSARVTSSGVAVPGEPNLPLRLLIYSSPERRTRQLTPN